MPPLYPLKYIFFAIFTVAVVSVYISLITGITGLPMTVVTIPLTFWLVHQANQAVQHEIDRILDEQESN